MKKILSLTFFLLCCIALLAQRPKTETFKGQVGNIPGPETSAPVTFTVDNTTGYCTFKSDGNGHNVDSFFWRGQIPTAVNQPLSNAGAVWTGQLTEWSDMTISERKSGSRTNTQTRLVSVKRSSANTAPIYGMTSDGKSITLQIRIPYRMAGYSDPVQITFSCTLDLSSGQKSPARSSDSGGGLRMPTGNTDISDIDYEKGITVGTVGGSTGTAKKVSVGRVAFSLAPGYTAKARQNLGGGQSVQINRSNSNDQLYLEVQKEGLSNVRNLSSDQVGDLLATRVEFLNTVMPGVRMNGEPKIYYDDNSDGYYHPHAYSYAKGKDDRGRNVDIYTEATLINKNTITAGCVIAADKKEFEALTDIYVDAVNAAADR